MQKTRREIRSCECTDPFLSGTGLVLETASVASLSKRESAFDLDGPSVVVVGDLAWFWGEGGGWEGGGE